MTRPHTPDSKRVRSIRMGAQFATAAGIHGAEIGDSHVFQDDIRVIGAEVGAEINLQDAAINVDGRCEVGVQLNATGNLNNDTVILNTEIYALWQGIFFAGGDLRKQNILMYPEGYGWDFDTNQAIYLIMAHQNVTAEDLSTFGWAVVYYVER